MQGTRPTEEQVKKGYDANSAGGGVAWRELNEEGDPVVHWKKGLNLDEMVALSQTLPTPFVQHFRIPSVGGLCDELCHPFPIEPEVSLDLEGVTKGYVLFHNGHWSKWKDTIWSTALSNKLPVPSGKWSDSRGMAWLAAHFDLGILSLLDEKTVAFGPTNYEITEGGGWKHIEVEGKKAFWASNDHWNTSYTVVRGRDWRKVDDEGEGTCGSFYHTTPPASMAGKAGGPSAADTFCSGDPAEEYGTADERAIQAGQADLRRILARRQGGPAEGEEVVEGREGREGGDSTALVRLVDNLEQQRLQEQLKWAKSLNPKVKGKVIPYTDLQQRRLDAAKGISHVPLT